MPDDFWAWAAGQPKTYEIVEDGAVAPDEALIALGYTTTLRERDAVCDLRDQYVDDLAHGADDLAHGRAREADDAR